jgi:hypothetical protein
MFNRDYHKLDAVGVTKFKVPKELLTSIALLKLFCERIWETFHEIYKKSLSASAQGHFLPEARHRDNLLIPSPTTWARG